MKRRDFMKTCGVASAAMMTPRLMLAKAPGESDADFNARMAWWREARFGMFIHWGIYAVLGLSEWAMHIYKIPGEGIPETRAAFQPGGIRSTRMGENRQGRGHEIYRDHQQAPRRFLHVQDPDTPNTTSWTALHISVTLLKCSPKPALTKASASGSTIQSRMPTSPGSTASAG